MSGIRTSAAAELLGVRPSTLRSWEQRFGYPSPQRTEGKHRQYELTDLEALRDALAETGSISTAIELARRRNGGPADGDLASALRRFDEEAADRAMEESLALRSMERTLEELLLPAIDELARSPGAEAEAEHGCRWASGWIQAARRVVPPASRPLGVLLLDSSPGADPELVHAQALELALRRAGFRVLLLSAELGEERLARAATALEPAAVVLCGPRATLDGAGRLLRGLRELGIEAPVLGYRGAQLMHGPGGIARAGEAPGEVVESLRATAAAAGRSG